MKFPKSLALETDRCRLRFVTLEDIPHTVSATRYPGFNDGMLWDPPENEEELVPFFHDTVQAWEDDEAYCFSIDLKANTAFIGRIAIRKQSEAHLWDLGFWMHPKHQGQGYMSEAVGTLLQFGFQKLNAQKIIAHHALFNKASERVLKKNGLSFVKHIPHGYQKRGKWVEENELGITKAEWNDSQH